MQLFIPDQSADVAELKARADRADAVSRMKATEGWQIVEALLREQLDAYEKDNAADAESWDEYLRKAGKIFGIRLLLIDIEDFERQGQSAKEALDEFKTEG